MSSLDPAIHFLEHRRDGDPSDDPRHVSTIALPNGTLCCSTHKALTKVLANLALAMHQREHGAANGKREGL